MHHKGVIEGTLAVTSLGNCTRQAERLNNLLVACDTGNTIPGLAGFAICTTDSNANQVLTIGSDDADCIKALPLLEKASNLA